MLPGLRFLFAAVVLATSLLVFGLGAASLFRAAHEEFASIPARRAPPEPQFAQQSDTPPVLAMVRVDQQPTADNVTADNTALSPPAPSESTTPAPAEASPAAEPEKVAAVKADDPPPPVAPAPDAKAVEAPAQAAEAAPQVSATDTLLPAERAPQVADTSPAPQSAPAAAEAAPAESKVAAVVDSPAATSEPAAAPSAPAMVEPQPAPPQSPEAIAAESKIATLGGPEVVVEQSATQKAVETKADAAEAKKKPDHGASSKPALRKELRRNARARPARQAVVQQQVLDPFGNPVPVTRR